MIALLNKIIAFKSFQVIGVITSDTKKDFYLVDLKKTGSQLILADKKIFTDFEQLCIALDQKKPTILLIDGKGVLNKRIDFSNDADIQWLKNLDYQTIHHFTYKTQNHTFISFCRKNVADEIIQLFTANKVPIIDFYIGSIGTVLIKDLIKDKYILSNETYLNFENDELIEITKLKEKESINKYSIGALELSNNFVPLYAVGLNQFVEDESITKSSSEFINKDELIYKSAFNKVALYSIVFFFVMLLASYLTIHFYNKKNAELNLENVYSNQTYQMIVDLERERENKMNILNETGSFSKHFLSFYTKELTQNMPEGITLNGLNISPLQNQIKANDRVTFDYKSILVKGFFNDESEFNSWIETIKSYDWVESTEILYLKQDKKNKLHFELKIKV